MLDDQTMIEVAGNRHPLRRDPFSAYVPAGTTVAEAVGRMDLDMRRYGPPVVLLIRGVNMSIVPLDMWARTRPTIGTRVEAFWPPQEGGALIGMIASAALPSAATWAAGALGSAGIIGAAGTLSYALTVAAITVVGSLAINSLIPPAQQGGTRDPENYAITGTGNAINRYGVYPYVLGRHRMFPPLTATGFSETVGRDIYYRVRATFGWCGPTGLVLEDLRIGSTPIWEYDGVELEFLNVDEARTLANMPQLADLVKPRTEEEHVPRKLLSGVGDLYEFQPAQAARSAVIAVEPTALRHGTVYSFVVEVAEAGVPGWTTVATYTDITTGQEFQADGFSDGVARRWRVRITNKRRLYEETTTLPFMRPESEGMTVTRASATYQVPAAGWRQGSEVMRLYSDDVAEDAYSDVPQENDPVIKYTRQETVSAAVDLTFPQGLYNSTFDGDLSSHRARFRFEYQRTEGGLVEEDWVDLGETEWSGKYVSLYRVTREIAFPAPDEYAIRITRTNGIDQDVGDVNSATLTAIRSIRDGKLPSHAGIAEVAFRIRANEQLNGRIDSLNAIVQQLAPELDSNLQWTEPRPVRHPAWLYAQALRGPHLRRPVTDDRIDLAALHAWATEEPHWTCDYVVDTATQLADVLDIICAAGRGRRTLADLRYSVVRDGAAGPVRQVFTPRNSWDYRSKLTFPREIHGFRCMVRSERLDWQEDEVLVLKDGYTRQTATELETLQLPGTVVTAEDEDEGNTYRLGRYHLATALHRPETHSFKADWESIHIQQGDRIRLVHDVPLIGVGEARVKALTIENGLVTSITLDDVFDLEQASFRLVVRNVTAGIHAFAAASPVDPHMRVWTPSVGVVEGDIDVDDLVAIEETEQRSADMLVMAVRPEQDETALIEVVDAAPHVLDAASVIPPYDPVITNPRPPASDLPPAPVITAARSSQLTQIVLPDLSVRPRIAVQLAPIASRADLDGVTVQLRWREAGEDETPWTYGESVPAGEYNLLTGALEEGASYLVEARTVGRAGKTRGWFAAPTQVTATTAAPAPPTIVASVVPDSIQDASGIARRAAIRLSWVAPANRTLRVTWQLRVAATGEVIPQGLFADASERVITLADGVLPDVDYEIRASFVTGAPDLRSWSAWLPVTTPDLRLSTADFADDIRDSVTTLNQWITDGVTDLGGDLAALEDGLTAEAAARAQAIADEAAQRIADAAALADRWRGLRDAVHDLQSEVVELAAGDHAAREEIRRTLTATLEDARAFFEEQIVTLADEDLAAVLRIVGLEAETGALSASITSIDQARVDGDNALAATIAALSVGSATQFDAAEIWHFDADTEGWTGGAWQAGGFLRATDTLHSPTGLAFDAARYSQLRMRLVRTGTPTWTGTLEWNAASGWDSVSIPEPTWTDDVALVTVTVPWTGTVDQIRLDLVTGTVDVDWIAMGRPAPGASSADLDALRQVISDGDNANASDIVALEARMTDAEGEASGLASAVGGLDARVGVTEDGVLSNSNAVSALQSKVDDPTTGLGALADALDVLSTTVATGDGSQRVQSEAIRSVRAALSLLEAEATEAAAGEEEARRSLRDYTASAEQSLNTRIDATDGQVAVVAEAVALLGVEVEGKASASVLDSLTATVTQRGEDITANTDAINLINAALPGKASTSALAALSGTVSQQGEDIAANSNAITAINAALPGKASAAALTALSGTVTQQGEDITANTDAINLINAALPGKASTSALAALSGTVSQQGEDIAANSNAITAINAALADKASAAALTSLSGTVSQQGDDITANAEALVATSAAVGRVSANGYFRVTNNVDQHGALSRIGLLATILDDGTSDEAAIYLEARTGEPNRVVVDAERFAIADNNGANVAVPFVVDGGKVYMDYAFIRDLSATAATIGTFRTSPAGERTEISDNGVVVYDNAGNVRVKLGDLS